VEEKNINHKNNKDKQYKSTKNRKLKKAIKISCVILAFLSLSFVLTTALVLEPAVRIKGYQTLDTTKLDTVQNSLIIYDRDGVSKQNMICNKIFVSVDDVPGHVIDAFISIEDKRFHEHSGVDYFRIFGALWQNIKNRGYSEGASTISQQVIKNTHLSQDKNLNRKINEIRVARSLERTFSKSEVMEMYLNKIYFGNGAYGLGAAAKLYFGKNVRNLTVNEGAFLAGIINNPSRYNPYTNLTNANRRRVLILRQMIKNNKISEVDFETINEDIAPIPKKRSRLRSYGHSVLREASKILGISTDEILNRKYQIYSNLNTDLQNKVAGIVKDYTFLGKEHTITHIVVMTKCGEVLVNFSNSHFNLSSFMRQPGSIIKPAIAYAPAFEKRNFCNTAAKNSLLDNENATQNESIPFTPLTRINDKPKDFNGYSPKNFRNKNLGWTSLSETLKQSQNIPAVELVNFLGVEYCKEVAIKLGMRFDDRDNSLSVALGGLTNGVNLFEAANSYRAFSNDGILIQHSHIDKILDRNGIAVFKNDKKGIRAISSESAYFINSILEETARNGTAKRIGNLGAAKTGTVGTSAGNTDAYVAAYTDAYIVAVWMGPRGNSIMPNSINGSTHPSTIAKKILELLPKHNGFKKPSTIINVELNAHEYLRNNRMQLACKNLKPKDKLTGEFVESYLPAGANALNKKQQTAIINQNNTIAGIQDRQMRRITERTQRKQEKEQKATPSSRNKRNYRIVE